MTIGRLGPVWPRVRLDCPRTRNSARGECLSDVAEEGFGQDPRRGSWGGRVSVATILAPNSPADPCLRCSDFAAMQAAQVTAQEAKVGVWAEDAIKVSCCQQVLLLNAPLTGQSAARAQRHLEH